MARCGPWQNMLVWRVALRTGSRNTGTRVGPFNNHSMRVFLVRSSHYKGPPLLQHIQKRSGGKNATADFPLAERIAPDEINESIVSKGF